MVNVVTRGNLGTGFVFDPVAKKINAGATGDTATLTTELGYIAQASVNAGQNANTNASAGISSNRIDAGWSLAGNVLTYVGEPDRVRVSVSVHQTIPNNANRQRPSPVLELRRNGAVVAVSATGYIRDISDHEESSNTISFLDVDAGTDPSYEIVFRLDSTNTGFVPVTLGTFSAEAVEIKSADVLVPSTNSGPVTPVTGSLQPTLPASTSITVWFFDDNDDNELNLNIGNQSPNDINNWEAFIENVGYADIPNLPASVTLQSQDNGDGTHTHLLTSTGVLVAWDNLNVSASPLVGTGSDAVAIYHD